MTIRKAMKWVAIWIGLALLFNLGVYIFMGQDLAIKFFGGYVIEQSLSLDNLFVFLMIFTSFGLSTRHQRRVLNYGIAGAIVLRFIFIAVGSALVSRFEWLLYVFGVILIVSGTKMMLGQEKETDYKDSKMLKIFSRIFPFTGTLEGDKFFVKRGKRVFATLLLAIVIIIELSDIIFAIDSIPAIFSITTNTFIVFTSNIFAILGLRSMYFMLEKLSRVFRYMKYGVAIILIFTGVKLGILFFHIEIPILISIGIIGAILVFSIMASVIFKEKKVNKLKKPSDEI